MTRKEFIEVLDEKGYSYKIEGDKIVVTYKGYVNLESLQTLPPGVEFKNEGHVYLESLETLPPGVVFRNEGYVDLSSLQTISPGVVFRNEGGVNLSSLKTLPHGVEFKNGGYVDLRSLVGGRFVRFSKWEGNIEGIDSKRLLNLMIKQGVFI